jgi:hypothetical protein
VVSREDIIEMVVGFIVSNFDSLYTYNLLTRTCKSLNAATEGNMECIRSVVERMPAMSRKDLRSLFVLKEGTHIPFIPYDFRIVHRDRFRCSPSDGFECAMDVHSDTHTMSKAFQRRQVNSDRMKRSYIKRREVEQKARLARRDEITQIRADLQIIPMNRHRTTQFEMKYTALNITPHLSVVYRDKMLMRYRNNGDEGPEATAFKELVHKDMASPRDLTHQEELSILKHAIGWEHYKINYSNFYDLYHHVRVDDLIVEMIEFLLPLPTPWPWINRNSPYIVGEFHVDELEGLWERWRADHDTLYPPREVGVEELD